MYDIRISKIYLFCIMNNKNLFEPNIINLICLYIPMKFDETQIRNKIKGICGHKLLKTDVDWLVRFYKYYSGQFDKICHYRTDIQKGTFDDNFETLFDNSLKKLHEKIKTKKRGTQMDIETEFHPYTFFQNREVDFGRGPRLRSRTL